MKIVNIKKISAGTFYKLIAIGLTIGLLPAFTFFGLLASTGMNVLTWNAEPVTGLKALYIGPLMGVFMALIFTVIFGSITVFGLWIFSFFRTIKIEYTLADNNSENS